MEDTENAAQTCERVTVALTPKASEALAALCGPGQNKTDAVNRALVIYAILGEQIARGGAVLIRQPEGTLSEVRFL
jgi:hypothetical protein